MPSGADRGASRTALRHLGYIHRRRNEFDEALATYARVFALEAEDAAGLRASTFSRNALIWSHETAAAIWRERGDHARALAHCRMSLANRNSAPEPDLADLAWTHEQIATSAGALGETDTDKEHLTSAADLPPLRTLPEFRSLFEDASEE